MPPVRHVNEQGIYTMTSVLLVNELRAAGLSAEFLDPPESRTFEVKKGAFTDIIVSIALNIGSSAAWDAIKGTPVTGRREAAQALRHLRGP